MHTTHFLRNLCKDATLLEKYLLIPLLYSSDKWRGWFYSMDLETFNALDTGAHGILVKKATTPRPYSALYFFAFRAVEKTRWLGTTMALWYLQGWPRSGTGRGATGRTGRSGMQECFGSG